MSSSPGDPGPQPTSRPPRQAASAYCRPLRPGAVRRDRATSPARSSCRPSTTSPTGVCCRRASRSSASRGATGPTRTSARSSTRPSSSTPAHRSARTCGATSPRASASCPGSSTTRRPSTCWPRRCTPSRPSGAPAATTRSTCPSRRPSSRRCASSSSAAASPAPSDGSWRRVVIEKPFGHDLKSARELNDIVEGVFPPDSVFRIDHYLGKETVQNLLALRFANQLFEPVWNANYVDHVQITMAEDIGIAGRAGYYDGIGAARDVIQNHLLQLLALTAMEEPVSFDAEHLRAEKEKVLSAVRVPEDLGEGHGPRPVRRRLAGRRAGHRLPRRGRHQEELHDRDVCRAEARDRHPPVGGRPVLPAHRQAARQAGHGDRRGVQAGPAPAVRPHRDGGARPERDRHPGAARRGHHDALRRQGAGRADGGPRRHDGLRLRPRLHRVEPRGLRAAHPRRAARRPAALPAPRGGRAVLEDPRPRRALLGHATASPSPTRQAGGAPSAPTR